MKKYRIYLLLLAAIIFGLLSQGCVSFKKNKIPNLNFGINWEEIDIGAVTFFTRLSINLPENKRQLVHDIYQRYGSVSFEWMDNEHKVIDILVKGAPIEWAPSFVQENIELAEKKLIYWRLDEIWYRANFQLYTVSFPFKGKINPDAKLYIDIGSGFEPVTLEKDGSFKVMLPFSLQKTIVFVKIELVNDEMSKEEDGNIIRYKRINIVNNSIDEITRNEYLHERTIYSSVTEDDTEDQPEELPSDDYTIPEVPEPEINEGPSKEWFKLDKNVEPELESGAVKPDKSDNSKDKTDEDSQKTDETRSEKKPEEKPIVLPKRKGEPPKSLERPISINVVLVFKGLDANDKATDLIRKKLEGFDVIFRGGYDEIEEAFIFQFEVLDVTDIKRIHSALSNLSETESLQMSNRSRYFGVKMTPLKYNAELRTQITGHVLPNSVVNIFIAPGQPEHTATVDEKGDFSAEIPLPAGTSYVYGKMTFNNDTRFFQISVLTGKLVEITKTQYELAIKEITEKFNKLAGSPK